MTARRGSGTNSRAHASCPTKCHHQLMEPGDISVRRHRPSKWYLWLLMSEPMLQQRRRPLYKNTSWHFLTVYFHVRPSVCRPPPARAQRPWPTDCLVTASLPHRDCTGVCIFLVDGKLEVVVRRHLLAQKQTWKKHHFVSPLQIVSRKHCDMSYSTIAPIASLDMHQAVHHIGDKYCSNCSVATVLYSRKNL